VKELLTALQAAAMEVGYVQKKGRNDFQNYNYVTESDVVAQTREALLDNDIGDDSERERRFTRRVRQHKYPCRFTRYTDTASGQSLQFTMAGCRR